MFSLQLGSTDAVYVTDLKSIEEMGKMDTFSYRMDIPGKIKVPKFMKQIRGSECKEPNQSC